MTINRESRPELFRLILMAGIVCYHILLHAVPNASVNPVLRAPLTILHIGVPCFVMLSGWFGIRPSVHGFLRLWSMCLFYSLFLHSLAFATGIESATPRHILLAFLPLLSGEWWFFTVYASLYVASPLLNAFTKTVDSKKVWTMVAILLFVSFHLGNSPNMHQFAGGKNLLHFMALYLLGFQLHNVKPHWRDKASRKHFVFLCTITAMACFALTRRQMTSKAYDILFFAYNSPGLTLLSSAFFLAFMQSSPGKAWRSDRINSIARSVFPVYLLHVNASLAPSFYRILHDQVFYGLSATVHLTIAIIMTPLVMVVCISIDKLFAPIHQGLSIFAEMTIRHIISNFQSKRMDGCG